MKCVVLQFSSGDKPLSPPGSRGLSWAETNSFTGERSQDGPRAKRMTGKWEKMLRKMKLQRTENFISATSALLSHELSLSNRTSLEHIKRKQKLKKIDGDPGF